MLAALVAVGCDGASAPPDADVTGDGAVAADGDGDGVPAAMDCDDTDAAIGSSATRACTSECATGTETCTDGAWTACTASADCACETPGEMRTVECGRCGVASQQCGADGRWQMPSECFDERECFAGEIERDTSMCGERGRICDDACEWRPWETMVEPGECEAGAVATLGLDCEPGAVREATCSDSCQWVPTGDCGFACSSPRPSPRSGADVVCIPAGPFVLGADDVRNSTPQVMVELSEYYIDRDPVTFARFRMCVDEGTCPIPEYLDADELAAMDDTQHAWGFLGMEIPEQFCAWDGGRLVGELQWEKAARGPYPDARRNSWGDEPGDCRHHPWTGCEDDFFLHVDRYPDAVSPFGVHLMGSLNERTATRYRADWSWLDTSSPDPSGPTPPEEYTRFAHRGHNWLGSGGEMLTTAPSAIQRVGRTVAAGFRCVY